jgi:anti-sigma B factor antagonist
MQLEKHMEGEVTVIALAGSLDSGTAPDVREDLEQLVPGRTLVLLDLSRMSCMSGAGLRVLLLVCRQAERNGARLALAGVPSVSTRTRLTRSPGSPCGPGGHCRSAPPRCPVASTSPSVPTMPRR